MKMIFEYHSQSQFKRALKESTHDFTKWKTTKKTFCPSQKSEIFE